MGKKYIIELEDKPFHKENGDFLYRAKGFNSLVFDMTGISKLTPYTEPDIEKVREEAYRQGYDTGYGTKVNEFYEQGLANAWEAARKIANMPYGEEEKVFGSGGWKFIINHTASEAIEKIRAYEQEKEEQITKGDVVRMKSVPEIEILVTCADGDYVSGIALTEMDDNCEIGDQYMNIVIHKVEKTGKHYDIAEVLRKMKGEN